MAVVGGLAIGACSGGNGTPFCDKGRQLVKAVGSSASLTVEQGKVAVAAYHDMANNIPSDLKDVTKKDLDDLAIVLQATVVDKNPASLVGKIDATRLQRSTAAVQAYNVKHCDIVYKKK